MSFFKKLLSSKTKPDKVPIKTKADKVPIKKGVEYAVCTRKKKSILMEESWGKDGNVVVASQTIRDGGFVVTPTNDFEVKLLKRGLAGTSIKMEHFTNHEMYSDFDVALAGLSFRGGGKSTDKKFAKQLSEETKDSIMIYDQWKDTEELEGRGWEHIKTEFIFLDGLKLDP